MPEQKFVDESLHGVVHGRLWIRVHGLAEFALNLTQIPRDHDFFNIFSKMTYFKIDCMVNFRTNSRIDKHHQVILLYYIKCH